MEDCKEDDDSSHSLDHLPSVGRVCSQIQGKREPWPTTLSLLKRSEPTASDKLRSTHYGP